MKDIFIRAFLFKLAFIILIFYVQISKYLLAILLIIPIIFLKSFIELQQLNSDLKHKFLPSIYLVHIDIFIS
jgi:hypothetical protein